VVANADTDSGHVGANGAGVPSRADYDFARVCTDAIYLARTSAVTRGVQFTKADVERIIREQDALRLDRGQLFLEPCEPTKRPKKEKPANPFGDAESIPPTPEQVTAYSASIGYPMDGQAWCDSYKEKGWAVGKSGKKMKDWQAAVRNWKTNRYGQGGIALNGTAPKAPTQDRQFASLGALQVQLEKVKEEITSIIYPGGAAYATKPTGAKLVRYEGLLAQRDELKRRIDSFSHA
jgi:hypothetical protein